MLLQCSLCQAVFADDAAINTHVAYEHSTVRYAREDLALPGGNLNFRNSEVLRDALILGGVCRTEAEKLVQQTLAEVGDVKFTASLNLDHDEARVSASNCASDA